MKYQVNRGLCFRAYLQKQTNMMQNYANCEEFKYMICFIRLEYWTVPGMA